MYLPPEILSLIFKFIPWKFPENLPYHLKRVYMDKCAWRMIDALIKNDRLDYAYRIIRISQVLRWHRFRPHYWYEQDWVHYNRYRNPPSPGWYSAVHEAEEFMEAIIVRRKHGPGSGVTRKAPLNRS